MKVFVVMAVCDQPDTRVDHGAVIKSVIGVLKKSPTDKVKKALLARKLNEDDIEPVDKKLYWTEVEETLLID